MDCGKEGWEGRERGRVGVRGWWRMGGWEDGENCREQREEREERERVN